MCPLLADVLSSIEPWNVFVTSHRSQKAIGKTLTLAGPKAWSTQEVIALCEKYASTDAKVGGGIRGQEAAEPRMCVVCQGQDQGREVAANLTKY